MPAPLRFAPLQTRSPATTRSIVRLANDRSVRSYDQDGRLRVSSAVLTKACVSDYLGNELPNFESLGLNPQATYSLLRPAEELRAALSTFNNIPILSTHVPVNAADHQPSLVIGATGSDAKLTGDELTNSLVIWAQSGIDMIESGRARSLSVGYYYVPQMQSGQFMGVPYQGVMRDIVANHLAVVDQPRVMGAQVGDAAPRLNRRLIMADSDDARDKLLTFLAGKLDGNDLLQVIRIVDGADDDETDEAEAKVQAADRRRQASDAKIRSMAVDAERRRKMFPHAERVGGR